jgi:hypothetical protein
MHSADHLYRGQRVALLTQHGKEKILAPVLELALGCRVELVTGYDTDLLGSVDVRLTLKFCFCHD